MKKAIWLKIARFAAKRADVRVLRRVREPSDAEWRAYADEFTSTTRVTTWDDL